MSVRKRVSYALAPLVVLLLLGMVPVSRADVIPEKTVALADTIAPTDVENLKAAAAAGAVSLTWDAATDNVGIKGYRLYYGLKSVTADGGSYEKGPVEMGNKITYSLTGLTNGTKYYLAVTAYDAAGNESESYSSEASATPAHGAADKEAPKVTKAEAVDKTHVKVTFNEAVKLPTLTPENAFSIKNDSTAVLLTVKSAKVNAADLSGKSVLLETSAQQAGAPYVLTAGIDVKDLAGNPLVSGTSDTAPFTGTDIIPATQQTTQQQTAASALKLVSVVANDGTHVTVAFNQEVILKKNAVENFILTEEKTQSLLDVVSASLSMDGTKVSLTTKAMKALNYNLIAIDVVDGMGKALSVENNATVFMGMAGTAMTQQATQQVLSELTDTIAPEDVTNFMASMLKKLIVTLNWTRSLNSAGDIAKYVLFMSTDGATFGEGINVDPTSSTFDVTNIVPGVQYFFKLVATDKAGNSSEGAMTTFTLPATGPELGLLLLGSMGLGRLLKRRKKAARK